MNYQITLVTILILIDGFLQSKIKPTLDTLCIVTILILIDGFLQLKIQISNVKCKNMSQSLF